ncbi:MAG: hypothetical protein IJW99_07055 [Clostridia bacterium]|nr:hypothetical protein [Clostridia bacterium]
MNSWFVVFMILSLVSLVSAFVIYGLYRRRKQQPYFKVETLLTFITVGFIVSLFFMHLALYLAGSLLNLENVELRWWEQIVQSLLQTVQTLGADGDYAEHVGWIGAIFSEAEISGGWLACTYLYVMLMTVTAPIVGGAWLFSTLLSWFPRFRLWWVCLLGIHVVYYFSELNERSLPLASSILERDRKKQDKKTLREHAKSVVVFTDAYVDDESETSAELLEGAKRIGAICVRDDLLHVRKNRKGKRIFFLIDIKEVGNLQTLTDLASEEHCEILKQTEVYLFSQDDICAHVQDQVMERLKKQYTAIEKRKLKAQYETWDEAQKKAADERIKNEVSKMLPMLFPVQSFRNLVCQLLTEVPLYEPLIHAEAVDGKKNLNVAILGTGGIGTEAFLTVYWIGQMLDVNLNIRIISQEKKNRFKSRIDYINPEILKTQSHKADAPMDAILQEYRDSFGKDAKPYFTLDYVHANVYSEKFETLLTDEKAENSLLDTDYFIVALGTDEDNLSVSEHIRSRVGEYHLKRLKEEDPDKTDEAVFAGRAQKEYLNTVISYVLFDGDLCEAMKEEPSAIKYGVYMHPFGSLREAFSVENIFMDAHMDAAKASASSYQALQRRETLSAKKKFKSDYDMWSNLARVLHKKYKMFSMGVIDSSIFDGVEQDAEQYIPRALERLEDTQLCERLAWLEHRRWNAHQRTKGFRSTEHWQAYFRDEGGSHKNMNLKLHPCLVEANMNGMLTGDKGIKDLFHPEKRDRLDDLTFALFGAHARYFADTFEKKWEKALDTLRKIKDTTPQDTARDEELRKNKNDALATWNMLLVALELIDRCQEPPKPFEEKLKSLKDTCAHACGEIKRLNDDYAPLEWRLKKRKDELARERTGKKRFLKAKDPSKGDPMCRRLEEDKSKIEQERTEQLDPSFDSEQSFWKVLYDAVSKIKTDGETAAPIRAFVVQSCRDCGKNEEISAECAARANTLEMLTGLSGWYDFKIYDYPKTDFDEELKAKEYEEKTKKYEE